MREAFLETNFRQASLDIIDTANEICADYRRQGFNLTLRQLYYQFVSRDLMANNQRNYKRLGSVINDARLAGLLDWEYIQDRTREVRGGYWGWDDPGQFITATLGQAKYNVDIWEGQEFRPEVWVEKDALVDVIARACRPLRVPYFSCRGYVSQSEMYEAAKRIENRREDDVEPLIIHLGDHDPSGIDMTRDIRERLTLMSYGDVEVRRIALTMDQIRQYDPPPNPAKLTDSRGTAYVAEYGTESWELDALEPNVLVNLIRTTLTDYVDSTIMNERFAEQEDGQDKVDELSRRWPELEQFMADNPEDE